VLRVSAFSLQHLALPLFLPPNRINNKDAKAQRLCPPSFASSRLCCSILVSAQLNEMSFAIMSEALEEILIQRQARSREANLMFQFTVLTLMRVQ